MYKRQVLIFDNTAKKSPTLNDASTFITVERDGTFVPSLLDRLDNTYIYQGEENPLTASRIYNIQFLCEYYLAYYPFDTQKCTMVFRMKGNFGTFVDLEPGNCQIVSFTGYVRA